MAGPASCTVYYDGTCPLCRREIAFYRRCAGATSIVWVLELGYRVFLGIRPWLQGSIADKSAPGKSTHH